MKKITALLLAALMLCAVFAGCSSDGGSLGGIIPTTPTTTAAPNPAYEAIFTDNYIIDSPALFLGMDSAAFASIDEDNWIEKMEYGYKNDVVKEMIDTIYCPIDPELSEEMKAQLETSLREAYTEYSDLSFCTTSVEMGNSYCIIKLHFTNLDNADNVMALQNLGMVTGDEDEGLISMKVTEQGMLESGFIKK